MLKCFRDSIRVSQNIARQLGVECPIRILYVDSLVDNLTRVKSSLRLLRKYSIDTLAYPKEISKSVDTNSYDALLVNESLHVEQDDCPLIVVPNYVLNGDSMWKLAYTLDEMIHETIIVPVQPTIEQQQILLA